MPHWKIVKMEREVHPYTKNGFIRHHFTGSWHNEENRRKMKPLSLIK